MEEMGPVLLIEYLHHIYVSQGIIHLVRLQKFSKN